MADRTTARKVDTICLLIGLTLLAVWSVAHLALSAFPGEVFLAVARALLWCVALLLIVAMIIVAAVQKKRWTVFVLCAAIGVGAFNWFFGAPIALKTRFLFLRETLTNEIERLCSGQRGTYWSERAIDAECNRTLISRGLPVAFMDGGLLDNWSAFVFDPTGQLAATPRQHPMMPLPVRAWFGGDMTKALPLGDGWFYCWFT